MAGGGGRLDGANINQHVVTARPRAAKPKKAAAKTVKAAAKVEAAAPAAVEEADKWETSDLPTPTPSTSNSV